MVTPVNVMKETVKQSMIDILMISAQVMGSVTVDYVIVKKDGLEESVNIHNPATCQ